jgi:hypothetical protein
MVNNVNNNEYDKKESESQLSLIPIYNLIENQEYEIAINVLTKSLTIEENKELNYILDGYFLKGYCYDTLSLRNLAVECYNKVILKSDFISEFDIDIDNEKLDRISILLKTYCCLFDWNLKISHKNNVSYLKYLKKYLNLFIMYSTYYLNNVHLLQFVAYGYYLLGRYDESFIIILNKNYDKLNDTINTYEVSKKYYEIINIEKNPYYLVYYDNTFYSVQNCLDQVNVCIKNCKYEIKQSKSKCLIL